MSQREQLQVSVIQLMPSIGAILIFMTLYRIDKLPSRKADLFTLASRDTVYG